eukprot:7547805-Lingulodinium_polyedra.AAC.1
MAGPNAHQATPTAQRAQARPSAPLQLPGAAWQRAAALRAPARRARQAQVPAGLLEEVEDPHRLSLESRPPARCSSAPTAAAGPGDR